MSNSTIPYLQSVDSEETYLTFENSVIEGYSQEAVSYSLGNPDSIYKVNLVAGQSYDFQTMSLDDPGNTVLYSPNGDVVFINDESDDTDGSIPYGLTADIIANFNAPSSGEYTLYSELEGASLIRVYEHEQPSNSQNSYQQTAQFLSELGLSIEVANEFIMANLDSPSFVFTTAMEYGVTNQMLADIVGVPQSTVEGFWSDVGFEASLLG